MDFLQFPLVVHVLDAQRTVAQRHVSRQGSRAQGDLDGLLFETFVVFPAGEHGGDFLAVVDTLENGHDTGAEQVQQVHFHGFQGLLQGFPPLAFLEQAAVDVRHGLGEIL